MNKEEAIRLLNDVVIFGDLNEKDLEYIYSKSQSLTFKKDDPILFEQEEGTAVYIILDGIVKIYSTKEDLKEVTYALLSGRDFFGEMSVLDGDTRSASANAVTKVEALKINRDFFIDLLHKYPQVSIALIRELISRLRKSDSQIRSLSLEDAQGKVASVIMRLADEVGRIKKGKVEIDNFVSQQELASMAATSRETISRVLTVFEKEGLIERESNKLSVPNYDDFKKRFK
jgi:CRP/FNR family cyclic AMP-dependent transcriptional regulator